MNLSEYEQKLCKYFERVELKGKKGRKVAVLLTPEMTKSLNLMIMKREQCGVPNKNEYLFAVPHCLTCYRGHQCLRKFADECGAQKPDFLRSTPLRKEMATTSQILDLKNNEMDQLADFLGHDITVHRHFYRLSDATIQSGKISKLLLALERGKLHELRGKTLDEIGDFTDDDDDDEDDDESESDEDTTLDTETADEINEEHMDTSAREETHTNICGQNGSNSHVHTEQPTCSSADRPIPGCIVGGKQKPDKGARRPWSNAEVNAVLKHFKPHIAKGHLASLRECELCKKCEPVLQNRTLHNIRDFVRNRGVTLKRKMTNT
ncbi:uncharacterized protein [Paramisgurnus dabryanus]